MWRRPLYLEEISCERLIEQEKINKKLLEDSQKLSRDFKLSRAVNIDLENKVAELAVALKKCQDEKKVAEEAAENLRKELEKLQKTHDEDLKLIENLRKDYDKSSKIAEDLRVNNAYLAKTLSSKEQKNQEPDEIRNKLELLFREYEKALNEFGVRPAPFPADTGISNFMKWVDTEFKVFPGVISSASDFIVAFSIESILKLLHDFDCADLVKFARSFHNFPMLQALQDFVLTRMSWPLKPNSLENSSSSVGKKLLRTLLVLSLNRLIS